MSEGQESVRTVHLDSGLVESVDPSTAQELFTTGKRGLVPGSTVALVGGDGSTVADFPSDKVADAIAKGWKFAGDKQVLAADAQGEQARAAAEGLASALTFGVSDAAMNVNGVRGIEARRETGGGTAGELVGMGLGMVPLGALSAGEAAAQSLTKRALSLALAPTHALEAAGNAVERAGQGAMASILEREGARNTVASMLGRGAENAGVGAVQAMSEESLGNPEANAESLLAAGTMGALIGGGIGAAAGGAFTGAGELVRARKAARATLSAEDIATHLEANGLPNADPGIVGKFTRWVREDLPNKVFGYDSDAIRKVNTPEAQAFIAGGEKTLQDAGSKLRDVIDRMAAEQQTAGATISRIRPDVTRALNQAVPGNVAVTHAAEQLDNARAVLDSLEPQLAMLGAGDKTFDKVRSALDAAEHKTFELAGVPRQYEERVVRENAFGPRPVPRATVALEEASPPLREAAMAQTALPSFPSDRAAQHWLDSPELKELSRKPVGYNARGENQAFIVSYETPTGIKQAVVKPTADLQSGSDELGIATASVPQREAAAFELDRALGGTSVPKTIANAEGSVQEFVPNAKSFGTDDGLAIDADANPIRWAARQKDVAFLDLLTANVDRHGGNVLWTSDAAGRPVAHAIDNGYAFGSVKKGVPTTFEPQVPIAGTAGNVFENTLRSSPRLKAGLQNLSAKGAADALAKFSDIPAGQKRSVLARLRDLQHNPDQLRKLSNEELGTWLFKQVEERGLSDVDVAEINRLIPDAERPKLPYETSQPTKLPGKALEGTQQSFVAESDRAIEEPLGSGAARAAQARAMGGLGGSVAETTVRTRTLKDLANKYNLPGKVSGATFDNLATLRGTVGAAAKKLEKTQPELAAELRRLEGSLAEGLERDDVWGKAATVQRDMNRALAARDEAWTDLKKRLPFLDDTQVDPAAISSYLKKLGRLKGDGVVDALERWQAAQQIVADAAETHFAGSHTFAKNARALNRDFVGARTDLERKVSVFNTLNSLAHQRKDNLGYASGSLNYAVGSVMAGHGILPALAASAGVTTIADPARAATIRARTASTRKDIGKQITERVKELVHATGQHVPSAPTTARGVSKATLAMIHATTAKERQDAYDDRVAELRSLGSPENYAAQASTQLAGVSTDIPAHASAMTDAGARALAYLTDNLPPVQPTSAMSSITGSFGKPASPASGAILKFALMDLAAQDPMATLDYAIKNRTVLPAQVATLRALYPHLDNAIRHELMAQLETAQTSPGTHRARVLQAFLGEPADASYIATAQGVHTEEQAAVGGKQGSHASRRGGSPAALSETDALTP